MDRFITRFGLGVGLTLVVVSLTPWLMSSLQQTGPTAYYVDPDWTGAQTGDASTPWVSLHANAWTTISTALTSTDVTVYFSAREANTDSNEMATVQIAVTRRDMSTHRLTLDGMSQYNTNDGAPAWTANLGPRRFQIRAANPVESVGNVEQSNVTVRGFHLQAVNNQGIFWWGGHNVVIEDSDVSSLPGATTGPALYFQYTREEGMTCPGTSSQRQSCQQFTNLIIRRNYVHDTFGEGIYVGGCANHAGCLSHDGVLIEGNVLRNIAIYGGESDAIDIKDGLRNVVIRGNDCRLQDRSHDCIVTESGALAERNYTENAGHTGITFSAYWNNSGATRAGSIARNNIAIKTGGNAVDAYSFRAGIYVDGDTSGDAYSNVGIYSNTVFGVCSPANEGLAIAVGAQGTTVKNNLMANACEYQLRAEAGALAAHDHNLYFTVGTFPVVWSGGATYTLADVVSGFEATAVATDPQFLNKLPPFAPLNFGLQSTSPAIGKGTIIASFGDDFTGAARGSTWDIGALKAGTTSPTPDPTPTPDPQPTPTDTTPPTITRFDVVRSGQSSNYKAIINATDNVKVARAALQVNSKPVGLPCTLLPCEIPFRLDVRGSHTVVVIVTDTAGLMTKAEKAVQR